MAADAPHPAFEGYAGESVPQAAVGSPSKDGRLELRFAVDGDDTRLVHDFATAPYHVSGTLAHDPHPRAATVFVQSSAGGIAQGDRREATIAVGPDAVARVTTGSATKVQTMRRNYAATETALSVAPGGHLDYVPEPTILHADARYCRELSLAVAAGGSAVVADVVIPGRLARGERFAFERFLSRVRARRGRHDGHGDGGGDGDAPGRGDGPLLFEDATHLVPGHDDPTAPGVLGGHSVYGTAFVVAPGAETDAAALSDALHAVVSDRVDTGDGDGVDAGVTELPNESGVVVRVTADRSGPVRATLRAAWDRARRELVGAPAPAGRKQP
jgi:urease accessory protein